MAGSGECYDVSGDVQDHLMEQLRLVKREGGEEGLQCALRAGTHTWRIYAENLSSALAVSRNSQKSLGLRERAGTKIRDKLMNQVMQGP